VVVGRSFQGRVPVRPIRISISALFLLASLIVAINALRLV
jgi:hypothetical protein